MNIIVKIIEFFSGIKIQRKQRRVAALEREADHLLKKAKTEKAIAERTDTEFSPTQLRGDVWLFDEEGNSLHCWNNVPLWCRYDREDKEFAMGLHKDVTASVPKTCYIARAEIIPYGIHGDPIPLPIPRELVFEGNTMTIMTPRI